MNTEQIKGKREMSKSQVISVSVASAMIANLIAVGTIFLQAGSLIETVEISKTRIGAIEDKVTTIEEKSQKSREIINQELVANKLEAVNASLSNRGEIMAIKTDLTAIRESLNRIERKLP